MKERDRPVLIGIDEIFTSLFARPGAATLRPRCVAFVAGGGKLALLSIPKKTIQAIHHSGQSHAFAREFV
jgi:hypothetical protein